MQIGTAPRRRSLLWFLKRNFSYLVQKSRPKDSDLLKPPFYKCLEEVSPKLPRLSDGGSFRVREVLIPPARRFRPHGRCGCNRIYDIINDSPKRKQNNELL